MERNNLYHQAPQVNDRLFGGRLDCSKLSFLYRSIAELMHVEEQDKRDWGLVRA